MKKELFALNKDGKFKHWIVEVEDDVITVRHGQLGGKMQEQITICTGKNIGRSNETTPEQQALLEAESKYNKQIDKCYRPTQEEAKSVGEVLPMLAKNYLDSGHRIKWPAFTSPKLDGVRCIASITQSGDVTLTSRGGKTYPVPKHIGKALALLKHRSGINIFDGELYIHGLPLQDIVSCVKKENVNTPRLEFHIFDVPHGTSQWSSRLAELNRAKAVNECKCLHFVPNKLCSNEEDARKHLQEWVELGFEGLMIRNEYGRYEFNHRSADLQKWKLMQDLEAKVIDLEEDKNGEAVCICELKNKIQFKCKMKGTHEQREYRNSKHLIGKWITVQYQALTKDGVPQFPVGLRVRECDSEGNPIE